MQTVSSMNTSINTTRLPAVWKKLNLTFLAKEKYPTQISIIDYGSGQQVTCDKVKLFLMDNAVTGIQYLPYDPYWGDVDNNRRAMSCLENWRCDLCVCANVLNVIDDTEAIERIINRVLFAKNWVFQIYEGDKTGVGKYTKNNTCYQRNVLTSAYRSLISRHYDGEVYWKGNLIYNNKNIIK